MIILAAVLATLACSNETTGGNLAGAPSMLTPDQTGGSTTTVPAITCGIGETPCNGVCVATANDAANCGLCGVMCGADQLCDQSACRPIAEGCSLNLLLCGQSCVDASSDPLNCGTCANACDPTNGVCQAGVCGCTGGLAACGNTCVDVLTDVNNCGSCSNVCLTGQTCEQGMCTCPMGQNVCGDACVDTLTDTANCGTCGTICPSVQACEAGSCVCPDAQVLCGEACVDTMTDTANCGMCGTACLDTQVCSAGTCACPDAQTLCGEACVDTQTDAANCGMCGTACTPEQVCTLGECTCPEGQSLCDDSCIDTLADNANCGACGNACAFGEGCSMGECTGGAEGEDGCAGVAQNIDLTELAIYQTVKIPIMNEGAEVSTNDRISDVVAGRPTLVRAFVSPGQGWTPRTLSARLFLQDADSDIEVVYSDSAVMVQGASEEEQRDSTLDFTLEPERITPDTVYAIELVECGTGEGEVSNPRFPMDGGQELGALETGGLRVHIIPIRTNNRVPDTEEDDLEPYRAAFLAAYPISSLELTVGDPLDHGNDQDWNGMLNAVAEARQDENPDADVYYYGMLRPTDDIREYCGNGCVAGVGFVPQGQFGAEQGRAAVGLAYGDDPSVVTMLHEVGHNHGRGHAPCAPGGQISGVDGGFPYNNGGVGVYGYDFRRDLLMTPEDNSDIMGYCDDQWLSDYTYNGLLNTVVSLNQTQFSFAVPEERIGAWQVLLVDSMFGARWGRSIAGPATAMGIGETADILDAFGNLVEQVTVYRTEVSEIDGFSIQVPEPQPGWHKIHIAGTKPVAFQQP